MRNLIDICQRFLYGEINGEEYVQLFDDAYYSIPDDSFSGVELDILSDIFDDNEMFEPNDLIRSECEDYIDESELKHRLKRNIIQLTI